MIIIDNISITLICTITGGILGYLSFSRHQKRDVQKDTKEGTEAITRATEELKHVSSGIQDIKLDIREINRSVSMTNEKVIRLEEVIRQHENRIEKLEGK